MLDLFNATLRWVLIDRLKPKRFVPLPVSNWQVETRIRWFISRAMHFSSLRRDSLYGTLRHWAMMDLPSIEDTANNFAKRNRVAHPKLWLAPSPDIESLSLGPWGVPFDWLVVNRWQQSLVSVIQQIGVFQGGVLFDTQGFPFRFSHPHTIQCQVWKCPLSFLFCTDLLENMSFSFAL